MTYAMDTSMYFREILGDLNKWRDMPCSRVRKLILLRRQFSPKLTVYSNQFNQNLNRLFNVEIDKHCKTHM